MRFFLTVLIVLLLISTNSKAEQTNTLKGKQLIANSDCMGCHTEKVKIIGPSYVDISAKYSSDPKIVSLLANKIIKGGKGIWGTIPMPSHSKITKANAEEMVKYILALKK